MTSRNQRSLLSPEQSPPIYVVSTGWKAATKDRCIESVRSQKNVPFEHIYVEASEQAEPKCMIQNFWEVVTKLPKEAIVVSLDGDDHLAHDRVLERVQHMHDAGAWVTYGNFVFADGRPSFVTEGYKVGENIRKAPWRATHLKTMRAGLFQRIDPEDLKHEGKWRAWGQDVAMMLPLLEMAGPEHSMFCSDVLCVYNYQSSFEFTADMKAIAWERELVKDVRARKPYAQIRDYK